MTKEEIEERHVLSFWKHLGEFPGITPMRQDPPEPDFFVETDQGLIGIEHTRLIRQKDQRGVDMMGHYRCANKIMESAEQQFRRRSDLKLHVSVNFRCDHGLVTQEPAFLANADIQPLAVFIADFVARHTPPPQVHWRFKCYDVYRPKFNFPQDKKIHAISIRNQDHLISQPCWNPSQGAVIPPVFESTAFTTALAKKNKKPPGYQRDYYQIWLLLVEDASNLVTYFDFEYGEIPTVVTPFDRVLVFRYTSKEIIELKVIKDV